MGYRLNLGRLSEKLARVTPKEYLTCGREPSEERTARRMPANLDRLFVPLSLRSTARYSSFAPRFGPNSTHHVTHASFSDSLLGLTAARFIVERLFQHKYRFYCTCLRKLTLTSRWRCCGRWKEAPRRAQRLTYTTNTCRFFFSLRLFSRAPFTNRLLRWRNCSASRSVTTSIA